MKQSLTELFKVDICTLSENFIKVPQLYWAIDNLALQIQQSLHSPCWMTVEESSNRRYLEKALAHYQGNLDELLSGSNTAVTKPKGEDHYDNRPIPNR